MDRRVEGDRQDDDFVTTQWSLVVRAGRCDDREAEAALAELCQRYWYPLYAYVRRRVADVHAAQDLTQEFFARLLEKDVLGAAAPERGRFRAFLLTSIKHFLANERDKANAQKRGGGRARLALDWELGESRLTLEPAHEQTPERIFERQWTLTLLEHVMRRLEAEFAAAGKARQFDRLKGTLTGDRERLAYAKLAVDLEMSEDAARQAAHRLRRRYRELLRAEVANTIAGPEEIEDEIRRLFESLGS